MTRGRQRHHSVPGTSSQLPYSLPVFPSVTQSPLEDGHQDQETIFSIGTHSDLNQASIQEYLAILMCCDTLDVQSWINLQKQVISQEDSEIDLIMQQYLTHYVSISNKLREKIHLKNLIFPNFKCLYKRRHQSKFITDNILIYIK